MEAKLFHSISRKPPLPFALSPPTTAATLRPTTLSARPRRPRPLRAAADEPDTRAPAQQITPPPEAVEVRFRRRSTRRARQQRDRDGEDGPGERTREKAAAPKPKKKWEEMSTGEKALELYVGEKGALFWLNKLAYAAIFVVIGGWIVFRFVGPALNLYQLDTPPLSPESILKGSP